MIYLKDFDRVLVRYTKIDWNRLFQKTFANNLNWGMITYQKKLSEKIMTEFSNKLNWENVCRYQKLSEDFMRKFSNQLFWREVCCAQILSEEFMEEFSDKIYWDTIAVHQKLSDKFILKHKDKFKVDVLAMYQLLSKETQNILNAELISNDLNWLYLTKEEKINFIKSNCGDAYEIVDNDYIIAYKSVKTDNYSHFNFLYKYEIGKEYEAHCDCNLDHKNSFGLSAWTKEKVLSLLAVQKVLKLHINIEDVGAIIVSEHNKIRAKKFKVVEELVEN